MRKRYADHDVTVSFHHADRGPRGPVTVSCQRCDASVRRDQGAPDALYAALTAIEEHPCALVALDIDDMPVPAA